VDSRGTYPNPHTLTYLCATHFHPNRDICAIYVHAFCRAYSYPHS